MSNFISVRFPSLNKNCSLVENDECIEESSYSSKCKIIRRVSVSNDVYNALGNNLLSSGNESIWGYIGGSESADERLSHVKDFTEIMASPELTKIFRETCYTKVVEVKNLDNEEIFYVNTEGFDYARYVGRAA